MAVIMVKREEQMEYEVHSELTQSQPFILSAQLSHFREWMEEGNEEEKEKKRGGRKDHAKLVDARA